MSCSDCYCVPLFTTLVKVVLVTIIWLVPTFMSGDGMWVAHVATLVIEEDL